MSKTKILAILNEKIDLLIINNQTDTKEYSDLLAIQTNQKYMRKVTKVIIQAFLQNLASAKTLFRDCLENRRRHVHY